MPINQNDIEYSARQAINGMATTQPANKDQIRVWTTLTALSLLEDVVNRFPFPDVRISTCLVSSLLFRPPNNDYTNLAFSELLKEHSIAVIYLKE